MTRRVLLAIGDAAFSLIFGLALIIAYVLEKLEGKDHDM
jgi:hypothetical protein